MSTHNKGFHEELSKIFSQLSSNIHFICSSGMPLALYTHASLNSCIDWSDSNKTKNL